MKLPAVRFQFSAEPQESFSVLSSQFWSPGLRTEN